MKYTIIPLVVFTFLATNGLGQRAKQHFRVICFFTGKNDKAHISFLHEAHIWFAREAQKNNFSYDTTSDWTNMNDSFLAKYDVIIFPDTRPDSADQRAAFERFIKKGKGWLGFHFAAFALTPSAYPENWHWYHQDFLGAGEYKSNTWRPTSAILKKEIPRHPVVKNLPDTFSTSPNEWYRWQNDLTKNRDIQILLSIHPASFPLGTGPKQHEIWHEGYYPVVWTNRKFNMVYFNMGHNDIDYENKTDKELSFTFGNKWQDRLVLNALLWVGNRAKGRRE